MQQSILRSLGASDAQLLGEGVEAWIYDLDEQRVVRIYKKNYLGLSRQLAAFQSFYNSLHENTNEFAIPRILSIGEHNDTVYTIDRKFAGRSLAQELVDQSPETTQSLLISYITIAEHIGSLNKAYSFFGEILQVNPLRANTWPQYIMEKTTAAYASADASLKKDVKDMPAVISYMETEVAIVADVKKPVLVHGDFNATNVLVDSNHKSWAVMDFGGLTVAGDRRMDLASALVGFMEEEDGMRRADGEFLYAYLVEKYGEDIKRILHLYRMYYAVWIAASCKQSDPRAYAWAVKSLNEHLDDSYSY